MRGAVQLGCLQSIVEAEHGLPLQLIDPDTPLPYEGAAGTSTGDVNLIGLAPGTIGALSRSIKLWKGVKEERDLFRRYPGGWIGKGYGLMRNLAAFRPDGLRSILEAERDAWPPHRSDAWECVFTAVDFGGGEVVTANQHAPHAVDVALGGASIPGAFPPVYLYGPDDKASHMLLDTGVRDVAPVAEAVRRGATHVDIILTGPLWPSRKPIAGLRKLISGFIPRALGLHTNEVLRGDIRTTEDRNRINGYREVKTRIWMPTRGLIGTLEVDPSKIRAQFNLGVRLGQTAPIPPGKALAWRPGDRHPSGASV